MTIYSGDANNNTFVDSTGMDKIDGGAGIDRITAAKDANFILTNAALAYGSFVTKTITASNAKINLPITDFTTTTSGLIVSDTGFSVTDINVKFDITHQYDSDLELHLVHGETDILLANAVGGLGQNFINTILDDEAITSLTKGAAPFTGSYIPQSALSAFDNNDASGLWQLQVKDNNFLSTGQLNSWSLGINAIAEEYNTLTSIEEASLVGGAGDNKLDASAFSVGNVSLDGGAGNDTLIGGLGNDSLNGGDGMNTLDGGAGVNSVLMTKDADMILNNTTLRLAGLIQNVNNISSHPLIARGTFLSSITVPKSGVIKDVDVTFTINHRHVEELGISLIHNASSANLVNTGSVAGSNFVNTRLNDEATFGITNNAPFSGVYTPQTPLSVFDGKDMSGSWSLNVSNATRYNSGRLSSWALTITYEQITTLTNIEQGILTGGVGNNNLDASAFTVGSVMLSGLEGNDTLKGGSSNDSLNGGAGNDSLIGGLGDDSLDGGVGDDTLRGGLGDDTYIANLNDTYTELANEGTDTIQSAMTWTLAANFENLTLTGVTAINGTGNIANNVLTGNAEANMLTGDLGNDTLIGDSGDDTLIGGVGDDALNGDGGNDFYIFGVGSGNDYIDDGSLGIDTITFKGLVKDDVTFTKTNNVDLKITINATQESVYIHNGYSTSGEEGVEVFVFNDATVKKSDFVVINANNIPPTGDVTITGDAINGQALTASNTLVDADGLGAISYQWQADGVNLITADSYTLTSNEIGKSITVTAKYTDLLGTNESVSSSATIPVSDATQEVTNHAPTGTVSITGNTIKGQALTASNTLLDPDGMGFITYQWQANNVNIGTGNSYTLTGNEIGKAITAIAKYTDFLGTPESVSSAPTILVTDAPVSLPAGINIIGSDFITNEAGDTAVFNVKLNSAPTRDVTINFTSSDTSEGIITNPTLKFTSANWSIPQSFTVTGQNDSLVDGDIAYSINAKITTLDIFYTSVTANSLTLTNQDTPAPKVETINGTNGMDVLQGTSAPSYLLGEAANDDLSGGAGNDTIYGSYGNDLLFGEDDNDKLYGEQDADYLDGGAGNDTLDGGLGLDTLIGGAGNDTYYLGYDEVDVIDDQGLTTDIDTVIMPYQLSKYTLPVGIEQGTIATGTQASSLTGNDSDNSLTGNDGKNMLSGAVGRDSLFGGAGKDILIGGAGNDTLTGGSGKDIFKFDTALTTNTDKITDFAPVDDTVQLDRAIFTQLTAKGVLNTSMFVKGSAPIDSNDYIIYNTTTGALSYDADGNGGGIGVQIAMLGVNLALTNADFVVI